MSIRNEGKACPPKIRPSAVNKVQPLFVILGHTGAAPFRMSVVAHLVNVLIEPEPEGLEFALGDLLLQIRDLGLGAVVDLGGVPVDRGRHSSREWENDVGRSFALDPKGRLLIRPSGQRPLDRSHTSRSHSHGSEGVCGEVPKQPAAPVHVLQAALGVRRGHVAQVLVHLLIPQLGDVLDLRDVGSCSHRRDRCFGRVPEADIVQSQKV